MSVLAGIDPAIVIAKLIEMPAFQVFFLLSVFIVLLFSFAKRIGIVKEKE
jgi:hypothetical protein